MVSKPSPLIVTELLRAAIKLAGSEEKLGTATGYSQNAIWHAKKHGRVTAEMAAAIDVATGGQVPRHKLRPDIFPLPPLRASSAPTTSEAQP